MTTCQHRTTQYDRSICGLCDAAYDFCTDCGADVTQHTCRPILHRIEDVATEFGVNLDEEEEDS